MDYCGTLLFFTESLKFSSVPLTKSIIYHVMSNMIGQQNQRLHYLETRFLVLGILKEFHGPGARFSGLDIGKLNMCRNPLGRTLGLALTSVSI